MRPISGSVGGAWVAICVMSHVLKFMAHHAIVTIRPMSPMRL